MRLFLQAFLWLTAAAALAGCSGRPAPPPVLVGHVVALSGPGKEAGEQAVRGIRLAVKEADRDGGKGMGRLVAVLHADTQGRPDAFEAEAVRLFAVNRAVALLGGTTVQEVERLDRDRVPVVTPTGLRTRTMSDLVFCTGLAPSVQGRLLAGVAARQLKPPAPTAAARAVGGAAQPAAGPLAAAAVVAPAEAFPPAVVLVDTRREEFVLAAEAFLRDLPPAVAREQPRAAAPRPVRLDYGKDADFEKLARQAQEANPALVLIVGEAADARQLRGRLPAGPLLLFGGSELELRALQEGPCPDHGMYAVVSFVTDRPGAEEFVRLYRAAFSEEPDPSAALAYEGASLLFEAMRLADGVYTRTSLREQLAVGSFKGLFGTLSFEGQVLRRPAFLVRLEKGRVTTLERHDPGNP